MHQISIQQSYKICCMVYAGLFAHLADQTRVVWGLKIFKILSNLTFEYYCSEVLLGAVGSLDQVKQSFLMWTWLQSNWTV